MIDDNLIHGLPLPLAQLCRRAQNAKTPLDRFLTAFYLWEAALKLAASVAIVEYAEHPEPEPAPRLAKMFENLARPALGHWWELLRELLPLLAARNPARFRQPHDLLLGGPRDDCPRAAALDALLRTLPGGKPEVHAHVCLKDLFDRLVNLRNDAIGHGAAGQRPEEYYRQFWPALLTGVAEVLNCLDLLGGRRLLHVSEVRQQRSGNWLVDRFELHGEAPQWKEALELPEGAAAGAGLPRTERLYVYEPGGPGTAVTAWQSLHPLVVCGTDSSQVFFLNSKRGKLKAQYLCYTSGAAEAFAELGQERRALLARVLGGPVDDKTEKAWAARCQKQEDDREAERAARDPKQESPPPPEDAPAPSKPIGDFELLKHLGWGGMGVVYRARQQSLGREVALKCLLASGDAKLEGRFQREFKALGRVEHPNLVKVYTSGFDGQLWYYAMELVEGADLDAICTQLGQSTVAELGTEDWKKALSTACELQRQREASVSADAPGKEGDEGAAAAVHDTGVSDHVGPAGLEAAPVAGPGALPRGGPEHIAHVVNLLR